MSNFRRWKGWLCLQIYFVTCIFTLFIFPTRIFSYFSVFEFDTLFQPLHDLPQETLEPTPEVLTVRVTAKSLSPESSAKWGEDWIYKNPEINFEFHHDANVTSLVYKKFPHLKDNLKSIVEVTDIWRYLISLLEGGIYADNDIAPQTPISDWVSEYFDSGRDLTSYSMVIGTELIPLKYYNERKCLRDRKCDPNYYDYGCQNLNVPLQFMQWTFYSQKASPLLEHILNAVVSNPNITDKSIDTLYRTGPCSWTNAIHDFIHRYALPPKLPHIFDVCKRGAEIAFDVNGSRGTFLILPKQAWRTELVYHQFDGSWKHADWCCR